MRAKKSYGQHFLTNEEFAQQIADALILTDQYDSVLEIGPGKGMLTKYLIDQSYHLKVVEADKDMVSYLEEHYPTLSKDIISANFLSLRPDEYFDAPFAMIGNYPYNISSQILMKAVDYRHLVPELVGMFQKEVAERVAAGPGSKIYGVIGILVQAFYKTTYLFTVGKEHFNPPPKVESAVIRLERRETPLVTDELWPVFRQVVKITFGQRRKMLRNTLKPLLSPEELLDPYYQSRPEQISVVDFVTIAQKVKAFRDEQQ